MRASVATATNIHYPAFPKVGAPETSPAALPPRQASLPRANAAAAAAGDSSSRRRYVQPSRSAARAGEQAGRGCKKAVTSPEGRGGGGRVYCACAAPCLPRSSASPDGRGRKRMWENGVGLSGPPSPSPPGRCRSRPGRSERAQWPPGGACALHSLASRRAANTPNNPQRRCRRQIK